MLASSGRYSVADKNYTEEGQSNDGYGGMALHVYDAIVKFKKTGVYPDFADPKENRNAHFHWRNRCKLFTLGDSDILLYSGKDGEHSMTARAVVRMGETRLAIRFVHEKIGHAGQKQTNIICTRRLYWRSMRRDITRFIAECDFCSKRREIRKNNIQLSDIDVFPAIRSQEEDDKMEMIGERLLLNTADSMGGGPGGGGGSEELGHLYARNHEVPEYAEYGGYIDDGYGGLMDDEMLRHENTTSSGLSEMGADEASLMHHHHHHRLGHQELMEEEYGGPSDNINIIVHDDDLAPAASIEIGCGMVCDSEVKMELQDGEEDEEGRQEEEEMQMIALDEEEYAEFEDAGAMMAALGRLENESGGGGGVMRAVRYDAERARRVMMARLRDAEMRVMAMRRQRRRNDQEDDFGTMARAHGRVVVKNEEFVDEEELGTIPRNHQRHDSEGDLPSANPPDLPMMTSSSSSSTDGRRDSEDGSCGADRTRTARRGAARPRAGAEEARLPMKRRRAQLRCKPVKRRLRAENEELRARLRLYEAPTNVNVCMQMPPADRICAKLQKQALLLQHDVLRLQRTYWQQKLANEAAQSSNGGAGVQRRQTEEEEPQHDHFYREGEFVAEESD